MEMVKAKAIIRIAKIDFFMEVSFSRWNEANGITNSGNAYRAIAIS